MDDDKHGKTLKEHKNEETDVSDIVDRAQMAEVTCTNQTLSLKRRGSMGNSCRLYSFGDDGGLSSMESLLPENENCTKQLCDS